MRRTLPALALPLCCFIVLAAAATSTVHAQGVIVPRVCDLCPRPARSVALPRALPIKSIKLETRITAQVATTHVEQIFRNDTDQTLEGTYFFPLPDSAAVAEFAIWDGQRRLVGEVRSREEARRIYDAIVRRQRDPGLLEYAGPNLFQASIFPIPARGEKKLELTYTQVLRATAGTIAYRYPLGTGHNLTTIGNVSGTIEIEGREALRNLYSPSHRIDTHLSGRGDNRARVTFESADGEPRDFQLFYTATDDDFGLSLLTHREPGKDGYFLLLLSPRDDLAENEYSAKDVVFVFDTSGSMNDEGKIEKARAALLFGVNTLRPQDRFNVVAFAGEEHLMERGLVRADERGRRRGIEFVEGLRANGGTNINDAMLAALRQFGDAGDARPKLIVFMTDGLPTVGETNPARILENARAAKRARVRVFTFGVGYDVNTMLLDRLANDNGGAPDYVEPQEDLEIKVSGFFAKVNYPALTDLALDMGGVETDLMYPRDLPDLFRGTQITLIGRYRNLDDVRDVRLRLTGQTNRQMRVFNYDQLRFPVRADDNDFLPRLWATRRVGWLMEQVRAGGLQAELRDEIVDLGTRYGIVTPYTSYLAVEAEQTRNFTNNSPINVQGGVRRDSTASRPSARRMKTPGSGSGVGATSGVASVTSMDARAAPPTPTTGAIAVKESKQQRARQEAVNIADDDEVLRVSGGRNVGGKTFYLRDEVWTDAEFKPAAQLPETTLTFGSDAYFELLKREPKLAEFFALGERVIVVYQNRVYRINAATK